MMTPPSKSTSRLVELEKRLEQASGPDRAIDFAIYEGVGLATLDRSADYWRWTTPSGGRHSDHSVPEYTSSIDAALALVSRALPGAEYEITTLYGPAHVQLPLNGDECSDGRREDGNVPLAICLALVRALVAQAALKASVP